MVDSTIPHRGIQKVLFCFIPCNHIRNILTCIVLHVFFVQSEKVHFCSKCQRAFRLYFVLWPSVFHSAGKVYAMELHYLCRLCAGLWNSRGRRIREELIHFLCIVCFRVRIRYRVIDMYIKYIYIIYKIYICSTRYRLYIYIYIYIYIVAIHVLKFLNIFYHDILYLGHAKSRGASNHDQFFLVLCYFW